MLCYLVSFHIKSFDSFLSLFKSIFLPFYFLSLQPIQHSLPSLELFEGSSNINTTFSYRLLKVKQTNKKTHNQQKTASFSSFFFLYIVMLFIIIFFHDLLCWQIVCPSQQATFGYIWFLPTQCCLPSLLNAKELFFY